MNKLVKDFYKIVDCMINLIIHNNDINNLLFQCRYNTYYQKTKEIIFNDNKKYPLIFCLGGMGYQIYYDIISKYYQNIKLESKTDDYDFSFCLMNDSNNNIKLITDTIDNIFNECIKNYRFEFEDEYKRQHKINKDNFFIEYVKKNDRLQIKINCKYGSRNFHILEMCFWYNGKISDNFTVNDFKKEKLFLYVDKEGYSYYLLPLDKLVKTTYYAILDNYEKNNFENFIFCKKI